MTVTIRPLEAADHPAWARLWQGYLDFYRKDLAPEISEVTWSRIIDPAEPMDGIGAYEDGRLIGFAITVRHRSTWAVKDYLYFEDVFVDPAVRGNGVGRLLLDGVCDMARRHGCARVYWHTHEDNVTARALYERLAQRSGFIVYRLEL